MASLHETLKSVKITPTLLKLGSYIHAIVDEIYNYTVDVSEGRDERQQRAVEEAVAAAVAAEQAALANERAALETQRNILDQERGAQARQPKGGANGANGGPNVVANGEANGVGNQAIGAVNQVTVKTDKSAALLFEGPDTGTLSLRAMSLYVLNPNKRAMAMKAGHQCYKDRS
ncbi:hypothetical protein CCACVL1_26062 [Corchorus capsularis]|uniref:Uncharacterized protein n=1 Tax=Corchorus capsularis TaxID=210143 RepID=A0A1R3GG14_COCAP|nr:hypothetical protein CCACVL1_26062 [Corchorus capsularis]